MAPTTAHSFIYQMVLAEDMVLDRVDNDRDRVSMPRKALPLMVDMTEAMTG